MSRFNIGLLFYFVFTFFSVLSLIYAYDVTLVLTELVDVLTAAAVLFSTYFLFKRGLKDCSSSLRLLLFLLTSYGAFLVLLCLVKGTSLVNLVKSYNLIGAEVFFGFVISLICHHFAKKPIFKALSFFFAVLIVATGSVKTIIALALFMVVCFLVDSYVQKRIAKKALTGLIVLPFIALPGLYLFISTSLFNGVIKRLNKRLSFLGKDGADSSASLRMNLYEQFYDYWQDHWLWGAGLNNFRHLYSMRFGTLTYSHNTFTEILVGIGVWGSLAYLLFFFCPFYLSYKRYRQTRSGLFLILFAGHLGFLVISMGQRMYANVPMMCFFALSMALTGPCFKYFTKFGINERYNSIR